MEKKHFIIETALKPIVVFSYICVNKYITKLFNKNLYIARLQNNLRISISDRKNEEQILVFQMGKVGSTAIVSSLKYALKAFEKNYSVYHIHFLNKEHLRWVEKFLIENKGKFNHVPEHFLNGIYFKRQIDKLGDRKKWKVVTLVRDPIARNISKFFQVIDTQLNYSYQKKIESIGMKNVIRELMELFFSKRCYESEDWESEHCSMPYSWFETELKSVFHIDVFSISFPESKGYKIYKNNRAEVLLLKVEKIQECSSLAFKEFLGIKNFRPLARNLASNKIYGESYRRFINSISIPRDYLDEFYSSYQVRHFYTDDEIENFKRKWQ